MAVALINRTMPWDVFIGALTAIPAFAEIVLPYISATDNSAFDPKRTETIRMRNLLGDFEIQLGLRRRISAAPEGLGILL